MKNGKSVLVVCSIAIAFFMIAGSATSEDALPPFGLNTVLVWKAQTPTFTSDFVIRIAEFLPDRYVEWEDYKSQGTLFMPSKEILAAKGYDSSSLFKDGVEARAKSITTMWLSKKIFQELKAKNKAKIDLDGVECTVVSTGTDQFTLEVNKKKMSLPVIKVKDNRGSERWFLDFEENPLLVKHQVGKYEQNLISITTDRSNTLRFIKGGKLSNLPH
jgi:hypothetical protein